MSELDVGGREGGPAVPIGIGRHLARLIDRLRVTVGIAKLTESHIETMFGVAMADLLSNRYPNHTNTGFALCLPQDEHSFVGDHVLLMPQYPWQRWRIDWALKITFLKAPYFFIECDGAEFHSEPEQIARDLAKDEAIRAAGLSVHRFTGSEINANAGHCAAAVFASTFEQYRREWEAGHHRGAS